MDEQAKVNKPAWCVIADWLGRQRGGLEQWTLSEAAQEIVRELRRAGYRVIIDKYAEEIRDLVDNR